ncbi:MAG: hypothetical protein AAF600_06620 [Bacteroidota bacterium]
MDKTYQKWFNILFVHEYWNVSNPVLLSILPTEETTELFRSYDIIYKQRGNALRVGAMTDSINKLREIGLLFSFKLLSKDNFLINYTGLPFKNDKEVYFYSSIRNESIYLKKVPIVRSLAAVYTDDHSKTIFNLTNMNIRLDYSSSLTNRQFLDVIDSNAEGIYYAQNHPEDLFFFERKLTKNLFGFISISTSQLDRDFEFNLPSRKVYLNYRIRSENYLNEDIQIRDSEGQVAFTKTIKEEEIFFFSKNKVDWKEKPENHFNLVNGKKKPLMEKIPTSISKNLKRTKDTKEPYLEIFINV